MNIKHCDLCESHSMYNKDFIKEYTFVSHNKEAVFDLCINCYRDLLCLALDNTNLINDCNLNNSIIQIVEFKQKNDK